VPSACPKSPSTTKPTVSLITLAFEINLFPLSTMFSNQVLYHQRSIKEVELGVSVSVHRAILI
jgi:hypothetical protein